MLTWIGALLLIILVPDHGDAGTAECVNQLNNNIGAETNPDWTDVINYLDTNKYSNNPPRYAPPGSYYTYTYDYVQSEYCNTGHIYFGNVSGDCAVSTSAVSSGDAGASSVITAAQDNGYTLCLFCENSVQSCDIIHVCAVGSKCYEESTHNGYTYYSCVDWGDFCQGRYQQYLCEGDLCNSDLTAGDIQTMLYSGTGSVIAPSSGSRLGIIPTILKKILCKIMDVILEFIERITWSIFDKMLEAVVDVIRLMVQKAVYKVIDAVFYRIDCALRAFFGPFFGALVSHILCIITDIVKNIISGILVTIFQVIENILTAILRSAYSLLFDIIKNIVCKIIERVLLGMMCYTGTLNDYGINDLLTPVFQDVSVDDLTKRNIFGKREVGDDDPVGFEDFVSYIQTLVDEVENDDEIRNIDTESILNSVVGEYVSTQGLKRDVGDNWRDQLDAFSDTAFQGLFDPNDDLGLSVDNILAQAFDESTADLFAAEKRNTRDLDNIFESILSKVFGKSDSSDKDFSMGGSSDKDISMGGSSYSGFGSSDKKDGDSFGFFGGESGRKRSFDSIADNVLQRILDAVGEIEIDEEPSITDEVLDDALDVLNLPDADDIVNEIFGDN